MPFRFSSARIAVCAILAFPVTAPCQGSDISIGIRAGTTGVGAQVAKLVNDHVAVRAQGNYLSYKTTQKQDDVSFDFHLKLKSFAGLIDLFPGKRGSFHFTGGIMTSPAEVTGTGKPTGGGYEINHHTYTSAEVGTLTGNVKWPGAAPYAGLGFGTPANHGGGLSFVLDLGAVIAKPKATLTATGTKANDPTFQSDLNSLRDTVQRNIDKYAKVFPVLQLGIVYRF